MKLTPHGKGPGKGVLCHHEDAEDGVDNCQDNDQRVETVSHFFPAKGSKKDIFVQSYFIKYIIKLAIFFRLPIVQFTFAQGALNTIR